MFDYDAALEALRGERDRCNQSIAALEALREASNTETQKAVYTANERERPVAGPVYKGRVFQGPTYESPTPASGTYSDIAGRSWAPARRATAPSRKKTTSAAVFPEATRARLLEESTRRKAAGRADWSLNAIANEAIVNYLSLARSEAS